MSHLTTTTNLPPFFPLNEFFLPTDLVQKILIKVKDPRVAQVCKTFNTLIAQNTHWSSVQRELEACDPALKTLFAKQTDLKTAIVTHLTLQNVNIGLIKPEFLGLNSDEPLDMEHYKKLEIFLRLHAQCKLCDPNFSFSATFDSNFDSNQADSLDYSITYMKSYLINMHDFAFLVDDHLELSDYKF